MVILLFFFVCVCVCVCVFPPIQRKLKKGIYYSLIGYITYNNNKIWTTIGNSIEISASIINKENILFEVCKHFFFFKKEYKYHVNAI